MAEFKTNVMRMLDKEKVPYTPHTYDHGEDVYKRQGYKSVAKQLADKFNFEMVAITLRESKSAFDNDWSAMLYNVAKDEYCFSKPVSYTHLSPCRNRTDAARPREDNPENGIPPACLRAAPGL